MILEIENTSMQRLAMHLNHFRPILIERTPMPDVWLTNVDFYQRNQTYFDNKTLYFLTISSDFNLEALKYEANLLIITSLPDRIEHYPNQKANTIILPNTTNMFELSNEIQGFIAATRQFLEFTPKLIAELSSNNRMVNYIRLLTEHLYHPVAIYDSNFQIIASGDTPGPIDPVWFYLQRSGIPADFDMTSPENVETGAASVSDRENEVIPRDQFSATDVIFHYLHMDLPDLLPTLVYPILYESKPLPRRLITALRVDQTNAYLLEVPEAGVPFTSSDAAFLHLAASFLQYVMASQYHSFHQDSIGSLVEDVISGKETDSYRMFERAKNLQFLMEPENYLLLLYADRPIGFQLLLGVMHDLRELTHGTAVMVGSEILLLIRKREVFRKVKTHVLDFVKHEKDFRCSVSTEFSTIASLKDAYTQCQAARDLGSRMEFNGVWFEYDAYRELHFILHKLTPEDIDFFCLPEAKEIVQYDRVHNTRYAYTLLLYLKNFKNGSTVASIMHTHRNTMFYRLEKIADMFGLNYDNPTQMNNLSMSFNILAPQYPDIFR